MKKLRIIRRLILILIVLSLIGLGYYTYAISPKDYHFSNYEYVNQKITTKLNGFKIAYISDVNLTDKDSLEQFNKAIEKLNNYPFDMVIFGGDLFDSKVFDSKDVGAALKKIQCKYGKFAVLGEKDTTSSLEITQILSDGGFEVLNNSARQIYYKDDSFMLIACDQNTDISTINADTKTIKIAITHQPDSFSSHQGKVNLQLSGHSYGGSIYIPYYGALFKNDGSKTYNHGTYEAGGSTLLVSNGFRASSSFPYKFLARNEINFITLNTTSSSK
ncbi:MAG: hypothetical protein RR512_06820 [Coprobacillus sp.]